MDLTKRLTPNTLINRTLALTGTYSYFWFTVATRIGAIRQPWNYLITVGTQISPSPIDLYGSLFGGALPSAQNADYGDRKRDFGPDFLNISSTDSVMINSTNSTTAIIWVAVTSSSNNTNYSLLVWGPGDYGKTALNVTDMSLGTSKRVQFDQRMNGTMTIFRYLSWGTRDLVFNFTALNGSVYVLANSQPLRN